MYLGLFNVHLAFNLQPRLPYLPQQMHLRKLALLCSFACTMTTMTTTVYKKNALMSSLIVSGFSNAYLAFNLQAMSRHTPWQVHLKYIFTDFQPCEHNGHHDHNS